MSTRKRARPVKKNNYLDSLLKKNKIMLMFIALILVVSVIAAVFFLFLNKEKNNPVAVIETSEGVIKVELYQKKMPVTVDNFIKLVKNDFYNGLVFHRVIDDFMIQGGGFYPNGTRKESPFGPIKLETNPWVKHVDGAISMARTSDPDSATSQFFICDGPQPHLDGQYAAFGKVIQGIDVVRKIASMQTTEKYGHSDWPVEDVIIKSIVIEDQK